ncbi:MAG: LysR family substrate-binding domain-containing protein [Rhodoglobus sp.]
MSESFTVAFVLGVTPGKWARIWAERMPTVPLSLVQGSPAETLSSLVEGDADVALVRLPVPTDGLASIPLYDELAYVVVPKDHAIESLDSLNLTDLADENVLDGDWADAIELVAANVGVAIMPQSVTRALSRKDVVARPVMDAPSTTIALVWLADNDSAEVEEFVGIVRGRGANSSRGREAEEAPPAVPVRVTKPKKAKLVVKGPTPKKKYRKRK